MFDETVQKTVLKTVLKTAQKTVQKNDEQILNLIKLNLKITQNQIALQLGDVSPSGVKYNLKKLKDRGLLKRIGADRGGYWEVSEGD